VGLKLANGLKKRLTSHCSNRTIVGLKPELGLLPSSSPTLQQSHHCGIETKSLSNIVVGHPFAAIAPLWD